MAPQLKQTMTLFARFATDGDERMDLLTNDGAMLDRRGIAQILDQHNAAEKRGGFSGFAVCGRLSLFGGGVVLVWWRSGTIVESLSRRKQESGLLQTEKRRGQETSNGMV